MIDRYERLLPTIRAAARQHDYAIGLQGSGERDLDLVAVPWTWQAVPAGELVEAIRVAVGGYIEFDIPGRNPTVKPHGRLAWSIHVGGRLYVDLSVTPLTPAPANDTP